MVIELPSMKKEQQRRARTVAWIPAGHDTGLHNLAAAIIAQAVRDAGKAGAIGDDARAWLLSPDCVELCDFTGLNANLVRAWVEGGCPHRKRVSST